MVHEEAKQENEIILDLQEKEIKSKFTLKIVLSIVSQTHSYALLCPIWELSSTSLRKLYFYFNE